jgi:hypothetical protein
MYYKSERLEPQSVSFIQRVFFPLFIGGSTVYHQVRKGGRREIDIISPTHSAKLCHGLRTYIRVSKSVSHSRLSLQFRKEKAAVSMTKSPCYVHTRSFDLLVGCVLSCLGLSTRLQREITPCSRARRLRKRCLLTSVCFGRSLSCSL